MGSWFWNIVLVEGFFRKLNKNNNNNNNNKVANVASSPEMKVVLLQDLIAGVYQRANSLGSPPFFSHFSLLGHGITLVSMEMSDKPAFRTGDSFDSNGCLNSSTLRIQRAKLVL